MPVNGSDSRPLSTYTVEQLMLIRKLKESGISREQIAHVFDTYDRLDQELGTLFNIPVALALQAQTLQRLALNGRVPDLSSFTGGSSTTDHHLNNYQVPAASVAVSQMQQVISDKCLDAVQTNDLGALAATGSDVSVAGEPDLQEFIGFIRHGETACCDEIRQFVIQHGIKQQQIAILSGICQSYVSRFLKGDLYEMSERSRHSIFKWYLKYRFNPALIGRAANLASMFNNTSSSDSTSVSYSQKKFFDPSSLNLSAIAANPSISDMLSIQRRERFVFRTCQVEILEKFFRENSYPSHELRAEIAASCNAALEESAGRKLSEREIVTVQIVSNWFANKRKDVKKAAKEGGRDISDLLLRSRGRPPQLFYYSGGTRDSNDYTSFASDDSASELEHCATPERLPVYNCPDNARATDSAVKVKTCKETVSVDEQCITPERPSALEYPGNTSFIAEVVKVEDTYTDNDYGVLAYSGENPCSFDSEFPTDPSYRIQWNGVQQESSNTMSSTAISLALSDAPTVVAISHHV